MKFGGLLLKDARLLTRNRPLLAALLLYPFLLAVVLGAAFSEPPARLDLIVVNQDEGGAALRVGDENVTSADIATRLSAFADVTVIADEESALAILRQGRVDAVLIVPPEFMRDLGALGRGSTLRVIVDESDPVRAQVAHSAIGGAIDAFLTSIVQKKIGDVLTLIDLTVDGGTTRVLSIPVDVLGLREARVRLVDVLAAQDSRSEEATKIREVIRFVDFATGVLGDSERVLVTTALPLTVQRDGLVAEEARLTAIALPAALVLGVFWTGGLAASLLVAREGETGAFRRLAAAPIPRAYPMASKLLVSLTAGLVPAAMLLALGVLTFDAVVADPAATLAVLALISLAAASLGMLAAAIARGTSAAALLVVLVLLPMLLLGGLFYPVAYMPEAAQVVARVLPVTLAVDALRGAMLRASQWSELASPMLGLALFALAAGLVVAWPRRRSV